MTRQPTDQPKQGTFRMKQFTLAQDRCAMKVGTDGVLLGAWAQPLAAATPQPSGVSQPSASAASPLTASAASTSSAATPSLRILDIGTGTGLVALMMAQRFPQASLLGIDIDASACQQAIENVAASPFAGRVDILHASLQDFVGTITHTSPTSTIQSPLPLGREGGGFVLVCNPPFFVNSLRSPDERRALARNADTLPFADLFRCAVSLLSPCGTFSAIIPAEVLQQFLSEAYLSGLYLSRQTDVRTTPRKPVRRCLVAFQRTRPQLIERQSVCLLNPDGTRSDWYRQLTRDFYLDL